MARVERIPSRILIVRLGAIGDVVNATVVATALRAAWPNTRIGWAVHELSSPLVLGHPSIDEVHVWRKGTGLAGFRAVLEEVRGRGYDVAFDLQRIAKSAVLARLSGARRVIGFDRARAKEVSWLFSHERLDAARRSEHVVDQYLEFVRHVGVEPSAPRFELPLDNAAVVFADRLSAELGPRPVLMHLGATKPANRWPTAHFASAATRLITAGHTVAVTGGPADRELAREVHALEPRVRDLCGATKLLELAELQRRSGLVISCDSGPMHLAASVGATVLALFGAADERRTGPYGARHRVLRTRPPCAPCGLRHCNQARHICMEDLAVESVASAALAMLAERTPQTNSGHT